MKSIFLVLGGYHFELDGGKVRWFHRDEVERTIFSLITEPVVEPQVWMHFTATYDAYKSIAKVCHLILFTDYLPIHSYVYSLVHLFVCFYGYYCCLLVFSLSYISN